MDKWATNTLEFLSKDYGTNSLDDSSILLFTISDEYGNLIDTVLLSRSNPELGTLSYSIYSEDGTLLLTSPIIFRSDSPNALIQINPLIVGSYTLKLNLPSTQNLTLPFKVRSLSTQLSMNQNLRNF